VANKQMPAFKAATFTENLCSTCMFIFGMICLQPLSTKAHLTFFLGPRHFIFDMWKGKSAYDTSTPNNKRLYNDEAGRKFHVMALCCQLND
jgi:hypothetical protein